MKYRKLRIAWSVAWGVLAVLLCVLWVRSYVQPEVIFQVDGNLQLTAFGTSKGSVYLMRVDQPYSQSHGWYYYQVQRPFYLSSNRRFAWTRPFGGFAVQLPTGVIVITSSVLAGMPWLSVKRFSLRTLLIVTTLVAVVLGFIVWAVR